VVNDQYELHVLASRWLEAGFFARAQAENTSASYASSIALFLDWAESTGRDLSRAAHDLHLFAARLATEPLVVGPQRGRPRSAGRINRILVAVREFYRFAVAEGALPTAVLSELYELAQVEELRTRNGPRVRHKRREPRRVSSPDQASPAEIEALLRAATTARDQFVVLLMALTGLRAGQVLGLRRQDLHLVPSAAGYELTIPGGTERCRISGEHVHVVRRRNPNGAWSKARFDFAVPIPAILVALFDRFMQERDSCLEPADNDMLIVALAGPTRGEAMSLRNLDKLFESMARRAGLRRIHPHMHFVASEQLAAGTTRDELQALLGWSDVSSAAPYVHVNEQRKRVAVERLAQRLVAATP
jgi:site-specific recombinase XerD